MHLSLFSNLDSDIKYVHHISRTLSAVLQSVVTQLEWKQKKLNEGLSFVLTYERKTKLFSFVSLLFTPFKLVVLKQCSLVSLQYFSILRLWSATFGGQTINWMLNYLHCEILHNWHWLQIVVLNWPVTLCFQAPHLYRTCLMSLHQTREMYESVRSVRVGWKCHLYTLRLTDLEWIIKPGPLLALLLHPADAKSVKYSDHSRCVSCQSGLLIYLFSHLLILFHFCFIFFKGWRFGGEWWSCGQEKVFAYDWSFSSNCTTQALLVLVSISLQIDSF